MTRTDAPADARGGAKREGFDGGPAAGLVALAVLAGPLAGLLALPITSFGCSGRGPERRVGG